MWNLLISCLGYIESISKMVDMRQAAEKFAIDCIKPAMERVGLFDKEDDDYSMPKLRYIFEVYGKIVIVSCSEVTIEEWTCNMYINLYQP